MLHTQWAHGEHNQTISYHKQDDKTVKQELVPHAGRMGQEGATLTKNGGRSGERPRPSSMSMSLCHIIVVDYGDGDGGGYGGGDVDGDGDGDVVLLQAWPWLEWTSARVEATATATNIHPKWHTALNWAHCSRSTSGRQYPPPPLPPHTHTSALQPPNQRQDEGRVLRRCCSVLACCMSGWWLVAGGDNILALVRASVNQSANSNNTNNNLDSFHLLSVHARTHKARTPHTSLPLPMGQSRCIPSCSIHSIAHKHTRSSLIPSTILWARTQPIFLSVCFSLSFNLSFSLSVLHLRRAHPF